MSSYPNLNSNSLFNETLNNLERITRSFSRLTPDQLGEIIEELENMIDMAQRQAHVTNFLPRNNNY